jgi:hypothetical protein
MPQLCGHAMLGDPCASSDSILRIFDMRDAIFAHSDHEAMLAGRKHEIDPRWFRDDTCLRISPLCKLVPGVEFFVRVANRLTKFRGGLANLNAAFEIMAFSLKPRFFTKCSGWFLVAA